MDKEIMHTPTVELKPAKKSMLANTGESAYDVTLSFQKAVFKLIFTLCSRFAKKIKNIHEKQLEKN